jgi:hypothetical protein
MPGRDYFSLRYAVPGFCFILITVGLNFLPIKIIIEAYGASDIFGVVLSFISLFASSAIGFIITQFWFAHFHHKHHDAKLFEEMEPLMKKSSSGIQMVKEKIKKLYYQRFLTTC